MKDFSYPLEVVNGQLKLSSGADVTRDEIRSLLETVEYERIMRPEYGLPHFVFAESNPAVIIERVRSLLIANVPDAEFVVSGRGGEDGVVTINVAWAYVGVEDSDPLEWESMDVAIGA